MATKKAVKRSKPATNKVSKSKSVKLSSRFSRNQMIVFVLVFAALGSFLIFKSFAASMYSGPVSWLHQESMLNPLDGQGSPSAPVYNTTGCAWNDQDDMYDTGSGSLTGSISRSMCLVADFDEAEQSSYPKEIVTSVATSQDTLKVTLTNDAGNTWNVPGVKSGTSELYRLCVNDPVGDASNVNTALLASTWPIIDGTNGGRGKIVHYTLNITSTKGTTRKVNAVLEIGPSGTAFPRHLNSIPCPPHDT